MAPDPRAAHSGELAQTYSALGIGNWKMETEPGGGDGAIAERSPRVRKEIMMAMFKLSPGEAEEAGGRDRGLNRQSCSSETQ